MGLYLSQPNTEKDTITQEFKPLKFAASSMQGWRTGMEDAHIADHNKEYDTKIFGVFDGHGGKEVAKFVEKHFCIELYKNENYKSKKYPEALKETFLKMDELLNGSEAKKELQEIKNGKEEKADYSWQQETFAGCTANVMLISDKDIYVANAGDSRSILSKAGKVTEMSQDHKPELEKEKDRIKRAGGFITEGRINGNLNLSRALGDLEYKKNSDLKLDEQLIIAYPDVQTFKIDETTEFALMGCDGIYEIKTNQELLDFVREKLLAKEKLETIVESLLDWILAKDTSSGYGCDNMTTILVQFKEI